jgi:hypothetical protein
MAGLAVVFMSGWIFFVRTADHPTAALPGIMGEFAAEPTPGFASNVKYSLRPPEDPQDAPAASAYISVVPAGPSPSRPRTRSRPRMKEWRLRGQVYDLLTLRAVPHCRIVFTDPDRRARIETSTDERGSYRTMLPALAGRGYLVRVVKPGYAASFLDSAVKDARDLPQGERRRLCRELSAAVLQPYSLKARGAAPQVTDFYIAPVR